MGVNREIYVFLDIKNKKTLNHTREQNNEFNELIELYSF